LLSKNNPNILEMLAVPEDCVLIKHDLFNLIKQEDFLSKMCEDTLGGYANEQIRKARGLNKKINNPIEVKKKNPIDFCYVIEGNKTISLSHWLSTRGKEQLFCGVSAIPHAKDMYALFYDKTAHSCFSTLISDEDKEYTKNKIKAAGEKVGLGYKGITQENSNELRLSSIPEEEDSIALFSYNKDGYTTHCKVYKEYFDWVNKRNVHRYNIAKENDYDCYVEEVTEFLTDKGWKKFDDVKNDDKLGTLNKSNGIFEWQTPTNRIDKKYTGKIYSFENRYSKFFITENHNLLLNFCNRSIKNNFSTKIQEGSEWVLKSVKNYFTERKSIAQVFISSNGSNIDNFDISNDKIKIIGAYVSEGSLAYDLKKKPKEISISQLENNRLCKVMDSIEDYKVVTYKFFRKKRNELTYIIKDKCFVKFIYENCGCYSNEKKLPDYTFKFSKHQFDLLLNTMISGDGHKHPKGHNIYYTSSKILAEQLFALLIQNGYMSQLYGPYKGNKSNYHDMYQVFVSKSVDRSNSLINKGLPKGNRKSGWKFYNVESQRVVCFSVPNETLITKSGNKVAIQGNCKNMMHCYRLSEMSVEIAEGKGIIVRRPNRDLMMDIRNGKMEYEQILTMSEDLLKKSKEKFKTSSLIEFPDQNKAKETLLKIRRNFYNLK